MSFFKDFKEDLTQAVNELIPEDDTLTTDYEDGDMVNTLDEENEEISRLEELLEEPKDEVADEEINQESVAAQESIAVQESVAVQEAADVIEEIEEAVEEKIQATAEDTDKETTEENPEEKLEVEYEDDALIVDTIDDTDDVQENDVNMIIEEKNETVTPVSVQPTNEVTVITKGTKISGNIESDGSIEIQGVINGNINCNGKITITGEILGDSKATEFYADKAKVEGEVVTSGAVKIGMGSVIIGNITASSAIIAGAIKGDIDVQGTVVVDNSAVVMGNIKSKSVQINNGAVIEGFCSQCYAEIDVKSLFGENK